MATITLSSAPRARRTKLNLTTAKIADGSLPAPANVYEIIGHKTSVYRTSNYGEYQRFLKGLNLADMQDHAYDVGEVPIDSRDVLIDRLERRFLEETSKFAAAKAKSNDQRGQPATLDPRTAEFMRRGR